MIQTEVCTRRRNGGRGEGLTEIKCHPATQVNPIADLDLRLLLDQSEIPSGTITTPTEMKDVERLTKVMVVNAHTPHHLEVDIHPSMG